MIDKFESIIKHIIGSDTGDNPLSGINIPDQFYPEKPDGIDVEENLNAAFLILLAGESHSLYNSASRYFTRMESMTEWKETVVFYRKGLEIVASEISSIYNSATYFKSSINDLFAWINDPANAANRHKSIEKVRHFFFPEGEGLFDNPDDKIRDLRKKRIVNISKLNVSPITAPLKQMVFTSNILITTPMENRYKDRPIIRDELKLKLRDITREDHLYWYDHPIPVGISPESNEVLYGLEGLDRAVAFEKGKGTIDKDSKLICLLSVSVTHKGLQQIAKQYLEDELNNEKNIRHLEVYVFTESDTKKIIKDILIPAAERYIEKIKPAPLIDVFGVDGEYGRHYSFLKAIAAFWQVFINPEIKGTFKIDLDQVFPQEELVRQGGLSAFEHLKSPLWGAEGTDSDGNKVCLGMIAGALVNEEDIEQSLFTPDVRFPVNEIRADELIFFSTLPQALSTEAEMMTRYGNSHLDGINRCIQRIHVTGGTCGILIDKLREYQPFTPSFIGRAEDQAYLLSVLFDTDKSSLRYVHKDGLIMRHDKKSFAGDAIKMAATGRLISDYIRILMFSYYVRALPWNFDDIKDTIDPFTGCFVSRIPLTIVYLRFALKAATFFNEDDKKNNQQGVEFMKIGVRRLHETIQFLNKDTNPLIDQVRNEREGWSLFYHILDNVEKGLKKDEAFYTAIKEKAEDLINGCKINF